MRQTDSTKELGERGGPVKFHVNISRRISKDHKKKKKRARKINKKKKEKKKKKKKRKKEKKKKKNLMTERGGRKIKGKKRAKRIPVSLRVRHISMGVRV